MRLKITSPGWGNYTGLFGTVDFVDGVSTRECTPIEIDNISANLTVSDYDDPEDKQVGLTVNLIKNHGIQLKDIVEPCIEPNKSVQSKIKFWSVDELTEIADDRLQGLKKLREIGDAIGVKGKSIRQLIDGIIEKQQKLKVLNE